MFWRIKVVTGANEVDLLRNHVDGWYVDHAAIAHHIVRARSPQHAYAVLYRSTFADKVDHRLAPGAAGNLLDLRPCLQFLCSRCHTVLGVSLDPDWQAEMVAGQLRSVGSASKG